MTSCHDAYYHDGYIYYSYVDSKDYKKFASNVIYRMKPDGTGEQKVGKLKQKVKTYDNGAGNIEFIYENNIFYSWSEFDELNKKSWMCMYNMKTNKEKYYKDYVNYIDKNHSYKQYYLAFGESGDYSSGKEWVLNAHNGKLTLIYDHMGNATVVGKTIYYVCTDKAGKRFYLYSCNIQGKNKKKLAELKDATDLPYINESTTKYCDISVYTSKGDVEYRYTYSSKKLSKK